MKEDLISIIIPVYNVEKYLDKCIESIINQTYNNIEIILVDDGSTDNSGKICDKYREKDNRIKVIHKENGGLSDARNHGLDIAKGKYVTFIDSDDFINEKFCEILLTNLKNNNSDISCCKMREFSDNYTIINENDNRTDLIIKHCNKIEALTKVLYQIEMDSSVCNKLFKIQLFKDIEFPKGRYFEDLATIYKIILKSNNVTYTNERLYYYYQRKTSILHSGNEKKIEDLIITIEELNKKLNTIEELREPLNARIMNAFFYVHRLTKNRTRKKESTIQIKRLRKEVKKDKNISLKTKIGIKISYFGLWLVDYIYILKAKLKGE